MLTQLTTDFILGMYFLCKYSPHVDWSQNTLSFVLDSCTVAVDTIMVLGSIHARLVSASAWLRKLHAEPESGCFLVVVRPCDGQNEGGNAIDLLYAELCDKFADVFEQPGQAPHRPLVHAIDLVDENAPPLRHNQYQLSANELDVV